MPSVRRSVLGTAVAALAALGLAACSGGTSDAGRPSTASGDPSACPTDVVDVVVSVSQWGDVVRQLAGDCAAVTTIVASAAVDPHDFEPGTSDIAAFSDADLVVLNGAGYDQWAADAVATLDRPPAVVSAAQVAGLDTEGPGVDPHLWYDPEVVQQMATAVTGALTDASPAAADYLTGQGTTWRTDLQPYLDAIAGLHATAAGRSYAATETVFDRMAAAIGLVDATPEGYRRAASNESDPAPGDLADFESALADGRVDVLVYNTQTSGSVPDQLRSAAEDAGVPVVEVTESPSDAEGSFVAWQLVQLQQLSSALGATP